MQGLLSYSLFADIYQPPKAVTSTDPGTDTDADADPYVPTLTAHVLCSPLLVYLDFNPTRWFEFYVN